MGKEKLSHPIKWKAIYPSERRRESSLRLFSSIGKTGLLRLFRMIVEDAKKADQFWRKWQSKKQKTGGCVI